MSRFHQFCLAAAAATLLPVLAMDAAAQTEPELLGRSGPVDGFLMPANSGFANNTVSLNDSGEAAIRLTGIPPNGERAIWVGDGMTGDVVATGDPGWFFFDATINNDGQVVWARTDSPANGIYIWDPVTGTTELLTAQPLGASSWGSTRINDSGDVGYRATFGFSGRAWVSRGAGGDVAIHAAEAAIDPAEPWDFLFTPAFNNARQIAGKALLLGGGNQIIRTESDSQLTVLAEDTGVDPGSFFSGFDNSPAVNDSGQVGAIAGIAAGGRGVFLIDDDGFEELARQGQDGVGNIEFFGPRIDNQGRVLFRAFEDGGRRAIWQAGVGSPPQRLVGAGDLVETDLGPARIDSPSGVEFSGGLGISNDGQAAFVAVLTDPDNVNNVYGLGIFRIELAGGEIIFADGFESEPI